MADLGAFGNVNLSQIGAIGNVDISKIGSIVGVQVVTTIPDSISLDWSGVAFDAFGNVIDGYDYIQVTSSGSWTSTINYYDGFGWITRSPSSGSNGTYVTISVDTPYYDLGRSGYIRFTRGTAYVDFSVQQVGAV